MENVPDIRSAVIARALIVKRNNAMAAVATGGALAFAVTRLSGIGSPGLAPLAFLLGAGFGVLYANAFEYVLHRFFLHWGQGFLVLRHALHHNSTGTADEARYVNFATSPWVVLLLFVSNAVPIFTGIFLLESWLRAGFLSGRFSAGIPGAGIWGAGIFGGFTIYYVIYEEIHWRIHIGGRLPSWLAFARRNHMLHHGDFDGHYNVFLPMFDWIFAHIPRRRNLPSAR